MLCFCATATESGRPITYFPVRALNGPEQFHDNPWMKFESVRRMVDELCGHPRGLRHLRELLKTEYPIATMPKPPVFEDLLRSFSHQFFSLRTVKTSPQLISACLLGLEVTRDQRPNPDVAHTYAYYIAQVCDFLRAMRCVCSSCSGTIDHGLSAVCLLLTVRVY
jgi:hypothetical protein